MEQNKVQKYLLYAIGEIALVMIGILLALQVNNLNEERKLKAQEEQKVQTLHREFEANLEELKYDLTRLDGQLSSLRFLFQLFGEKDLPPEEKIDSLILTSLGHITWNPSSYMLNDLKNSGQISSLSNTELQSLLFKWERHYENLLEWTDSDYDVSKVFLAYLREHASLRNIDHTAPIPGKGDWGRSTFGFNNSRLLTEIEFENIIDDKLAITLHLKDQYQKSEVIINELLRLTGQ